MEWEIGFDFIRIGAAFMVGAYLSLAGSLSQGMTQNDLAAPSTLGMNAFVVLGILLAHMIYSSLSTTFSFEWFSLGVFLVPFIGLIGLRLFKGTERLFYSPKEKSPVGFYLLVGLCFNLFVGAIFSLMQFVFMTYDIDFPTELWYGHFRFVSLEMLVFLVLCFLPIAFFLFPKRFEYAALSFGSSFSSGLGFNTQRRQTQGLIICLFLIGVCTNFFGVFAFLGLLFPHILRSFDFFKYHYERELTYGVLVNGFILSIIDTLCYQLSFRGAELPAGLITAVFGGIVLMFLLWKRGRKLA